MFYLFQVLCNALWYVTNHHQTINDASLRKQTLLPVPNIFNDYDGYNEVKRKKLKSCPLSASLLDSHAQALYSLLMKPVVNSSVSWKQGAEDIKQLAECFTAYKEYLVVQNKTAKENQSKLYPVRTIDKEATIEHRYGNLSGQIREKYVDINEAVTSAGIMAPVVFDEYKHLDKPFESNLERFRYFQDLQLKCPVDIIRFSPGGSSVSTVCIVQVSNQNRSNAEMLTQGARLLQTVRPNLKEYHTRAQRRLFKEKLKNVASVLPSVANLIYQELALDFSAAEHPVTQERLRLIFLGQNDLIPDLRVLNPGRPNNKFDVFFETLSKEVEKITAADDRRHGTAHLSEFISLEEMVEKTAKSCPEGTDIPSKSLVRLQFAPRNPYARSALNFTGKIDVQYKVQRRQLRIDHPDDHYCNAQFRYLKEMAIEMREHCALLFCDDKAKVSIGEPGSPVSTGVRGKKTIVPSSSTLVSLDHDMTKASLTPSVILHCKIPGSINDSFVRGQVTVTVNDSVFQMSSPFRHAVSIIKAFEQQGHFPYTLLKFTDGGTDQRNTLESVKCASICVFKEMNLDMMILARCAPGHSYVNPAERVMSILNLALQNVALERKESTEKMNKVLKSCNSMADVRNLAEKTPEVKTAWIESVEPVASVLRNRFLRLKLKDDPVKALDPVSDQEIDILKRHLRELFPNLDLKKLQKVHTSKVESYQKWIETHCRSRQYTFQIRKCRDENCCLPPRLRDEQMQWLPDPVLNETKDHYKSYNEVKGTETNESDRPSLKAKPIKEKKLNLRATVNVTTSNPVNDIFEEEEFEVPTPDAHLCITQNARAIVECVECRKPRVVYSHHKLTERQIMSFTISISEYEYTCGSPLLPPTNSMSKKVMSRLNINCDSHVELAYYGSGLGQVDICSVCAEPEADTNAELKKQYKTVLPLCKTCEGNGRVPFIQRPYGKKN